MSDHGNGMEMKAHEATYGSFLTLFKVGMVVVAIIAAFVIMLITR